MQITEPRDPKVPRTATCNDCLRRGRRGGFAKFPAGSPGLVQWRERHAKHERGAS